MRVRVEAHQIGEPIEGEWCDRCALPSVARVRYVIVPTFDPTQVWWAGWINVCRDCGAQTRERDYGLAGPRAFD